MKFVGALLAVNIVLVVGYFAFATKTDGARIVLFSSIALTTAAILIMGDRITGLKNKLIGEIEASAEQAGASAERVKAIEVQVASQRDRVDEVASDAFRSREEIGRVENLAKGAKQKADELGRLTAEASENVAAQKEITDFSLVLIRFQNDDRLAFDDLIRISKNGKEPFKALADQALVGYLNTGSVLGFGMGTNSLLKLPTPFDVNTASLGEYRDAISSNTPEISIVILDASWAQARFSWHERLELLVGVIQTTKSLRVLLDALRLLEQEARLHVGARDWPAYIEWWKLNQANYPKSTQTIAPGIK